MEFGHSYKFARHRFIYGTKWWIRLPLFQSTKGKTQVGYEWSMIENIDPWPTKGNRQVDYFLTLPNNLQNFTEGSMLPGHMFFFYSVETFFFLIGWHFDFEKMFGWLLFGFFKIKKIFGCGMIGYFIFKKNIRLGMIGYYFFVKKISVGLYSVFR